LEDESMLIEQAKSGDHVALSVLLQKNYAFLVKNLIKITFDPAIAEDLAQETMLRAIEKIRLYNGQSKFSSWLITIATRLFIDHKRKEKRERLWQEQEGALRRMRWHYEQMNEEWPLALEALGKISEEIRIPIVMKHYYGYSLEEISDLLGIPIGTVKSRIHNGLKHIRREINPIEEE
jgi:RNA polymerase sigma-70 factor (ECF subfamily)